MRKKIIEAGGHADLTLGARMRMARLSAGLFLADAAKEVGVTKQAVGYWEMDRTEPPVSALQKLAKLYEINLMWLIAGEGATSPAASAAAVAGPDRQAELLETIRTMRNAGLVVTRVVLSGISIEIEIPSAVDNPVDNSVDNLDRRGSTNTPNKNRDQLIVDARK
jgi:transcriptional regulator with XRE-family HTH domain